MTWEGLRLITGVINRLYLLTVIFAVLWVKGYLWWMLGVAAVLYVATIPLPYRFSLPDEDDEDEDDTTDEDEDDMPPPSLPPRRSRR